MSAACPNCGAPGAPGALSCIYCGKQLTDAAPIAQAAPGQPAGGYPNAQPGTPIGQQAGIQCPRCGVLNMQSSMQCAGCHAPITQTCIFCQRPSPISLPNCAACGEAFAGAVERKAQYDAQHRRDEVMHVIGAVAAPLAGVAIGGIAGALLGSGPRPDPAYGQGYGYGQPGYPPPGYPPQRYPDQGPYGDPSRGYGGYAPGGYPTQGTLGSSGVEPYSRGSVDDEASAVAAAVGGHHHGHSGFAQTYDDGAGRGDRSAFEQAMGGGHARGEDRNAFEQAMGGGSSSRDDRNAFEQAMSDGSSRSDRSGFEQAMGGTRDDRSAFENAVDDTSSSDDSGSSDDS